MVDPEARRQLTPDAAPEHRSGWHDLLLERVPFGTALRMCGLFLGMWMVGNWFGDLPHLGQGLRGLFGLVAAGGCCLFVAASYVAVRAWQLRRPR
jgi:hypothetical protein